MSTISEKYRKDYKNVQFSNPRLIQKRERRQKKLKQLIIVLAIFVIMATGYSLFFSSFFRIKHLETIGFEKIKSANVEKIVGDYMASRSFWIFSRNNFFVFNSRSVMREIGKYYSLESCQVSRRWPSTVIIKIAEKEALIQWQVKDLCYYLDSTGTAIEYCDGESGLPNIKFRVKDMTEKDLKIGESAVLADELQSLMQLNKELSQLNFITAEIFEKDGSVVEVKTVQGPILKFNLKLDAMEQVLRLSMLLQSEGLKNEWSTKQYFDLRFGQKVYYK